MVKQKNLVYFTIKKIVEYIKFFFSSKFCIGPGFPSAYRIHGTQFAKFTAGCQQFFNPDLPSKMLKLLTGRFY